MCSSTSSGLCNLDNRPTDFMKLFIRAKHVHDTLLAGGGGPPTGRWGGGGG